MRVIGDVLRRLDPRLQLTGVLGRGQALGDDDVEQHGQQDRCEHDQQRPPLVAEHPVQRDVVAGRSPASKMRGTARAKAAARSGV